MVRVVGALLERGVMGGGGRGGEGGCLRAMYCHLADLLIVLC